jgi:hypothetical protein
MTTSAPLRVGWVERQLLAGADLRESHHYLDVLRARHMRGAHATWGVALGLSVSDAGGGLVEIGPGLAYDARGRELLVSRPIHLAADVAGVQKIARIVVLQSRSDACVPQAVARVMPEPAPLRPGLDIELATIDADGVIDIDFRPHVCSLAAPRVAAGTVPIAGAGITGSEVGFTAKIDTSIGDFVDTPVYAVHAENVAPGAPSNALGPLLTVSNASANGFTLEVRYVFRSVSDYTKAYAKAGRGGALPFALNWLGVEPPRLCGVLPSADPNCPCLV